MPFPLYRGGSHSIIALAKLLVAGLVRLTGDETLPVETRNNYIVRYLDALKGGISFRLKMVCHPEV